MTELAKKYEPNAIEDKWYAYWLKHKFFDSQPDAREAYSIVIPPPNVTGVLHMGHMLNNTVQDILIRKARMEGKNACWVPGTDHASIATEAKVVGMLREKGIKKSDLSREEFLAHAFEWKDKYGGIILEQLKKLGVSCDWKRTRFTMEESLSEAVADVFIDLYKKGLIYRGLRMINWDPAAKTTLSNEEVNHKEEQNKLFYVKYRIKGSEAYLAVATVRPETIPGDTAVAVNPNDERHRDLIGKTVIVPMVNREVPVIADTYVDMEFGTGALKVTPAHDVNDYEIGVRHKLAVIDCFNPDGTMSEAAAVFVGLDRFVARKKAAEQLEQEGLLLKTEIITNKVGYSERTNAVVEPRLSLQWFVDMKKFMAKNPQVLSDVMEDKIKFHPAKYKNTYKHWIENIKDWCISRQLWWGQQIPAWYNSNGDLVAVAKTKEEAIQQSGQQNLTQDEDVVDTWFSSWLWPISVFDPGFFGRNDKKGNADLTYYYPTRELVTAPEIMFFWVMRMIMAGYEWMGEKPFSHVYYTGIVRDKLHRKMSKSLGNSPDPLELFEKYGADSVRMGVLLCSPAGNDILYDDSLVEQGRNFCNKIWNALRLVKGWEVADSECTNELALKWFESSMHDHMERIESLIGEYKLSEALMLLYKLIWDEFCSWYLEMVKPEFGKAIDRKTYEQTIQYFETLMKLLHPFQPFITEEVYQTLRERVATDSICVAAWPKTQAGDKKLLDTIEKVKDIIGKTREIRNADGLSFKQSIAFYYRDGSQWIETYRPLIAKLTNADIFQETKEEPKGSKGFVCGKEAFLIVTGKQIDEALERKKIDEEIEYIKGFIASVEKKLSNENFTSKAPQKVLENEQKKKADGEARLKTLLDSLRLLN